MEIEIELTPSMIEALDRYIAGQPGPATRKTSIEFLLRESLISLGLFASCKDDEDDS